MSPRQLIFAACLTLFVTAVGYLSYKTDNPQEIIKPQTAQADKAPDFFTRNARMREYGPDGQLESTLDSQEISHFPHTGITLLAEPDMWNYQNGDKLPWHSTSQNGRILPDGETVELIKDVVMIQVAPDGSAEQRIDTDFLTVYSGQDFADTDAPARLTNATSVVNTVGMRAFYKRDFIQLKSKVRSIHESR